VNGPAAQEHGKANQGQCSSALGRAPNEAALPFWKQCKAAYRGRSRQMSFVP
jgi:hypothetical protein